MKYLIIFIYLATNVFLFFINWTLFTTSLDIDLGFGSFKTLPLVALQAFGLFMLVIYMIWNSMKELKNEVLVASLQKQVIELQKNAEIKQLKNDAKDLSKHQDKSNILAVES